MAARGVGPVSIAVAVAAWAALLLLGWALVYWPHLDSGFVYSDGLDRSSRAGFLDAVYVSAVTLATLGFGDVVPSAAWLRVLVPVQALMGFAVITAAVSWVLQLQPALVRRRVLAVRLGVLDTAGTVRLLAGGPSVLAPSLLVQLAAEVARQRVDLTQYSEMYYFADPQPDLSLPATLVVALDLAEAARSAPQRDTRHAGELLDAAVEAYLRVVDERFLHVDGSARAIAAAYAADHARRRVHSGGAGSR